MTKAELTFKTYDWSSGRDIEPRPLAREPCAEPLSHRNSLTLTHSLTHSDSPDDIVHYGLARKHKNNRRRGIYKGRQKWPLTKLAFSHTVSLYTRELQTSETIRKKC